MFRRTTRIHVLRGGRDKWELKRLPRLKMIKGEGGFFWDRSLASRKISGGKTRVGQVNPHFGPRKTQAGVSGVPREGIA